MVQKAPWIVAVYGGQGASAIAARLGDRLREAGYLTGLACGAGTIVDGILTIPGDCATTSAAADLLLHPKIEAAVIQTSEQAILREGLPFDRCDVLIVVDAPDSNLPPACRLLLESAATALIPDSAPWAAEAGSAGCAKIVLCPDSDDHCTTLEKALAVLTAGS